MSQPPTTPLDDALFVGVDIAAATVTASWLAPGGRPSQPVTVEQTPAGHAALQRRLLAVDHAPVATLVALEATGSYWLTLATTLTHAGFRVAVINPAQAHHFAKALLTRAKTDAIDAQTLAHLAALLRPVPWTPPQPSMTNCSSGWSSATPCSACASRRPTSSTPSARFRSLCQWCGNGWRS